MVFPWEIPSFFCRWWRCWPFWCSTFLRTSCTCRTLWNGGLGWLVNWRHQKKATKSVGIWVKTCQNPENSMDFMWKIAKLPSGCLLHSHGIDGPNRNRWFTVFTNGGSFHDKLLNNQMVYHLAISTLIRFIIGFITHIVAFPTAELSNTNLVSAMANPTIPCCSSVGYISNDPVIIPSSPL